MRALALIGLISILVLFRQVVITPFDPKNTTRSVSTGGIDTYAEEAMDSSLAYAERGIAPQAISSLYDEDIAAETDDKVIKTGSLSLVVDHTDETAIAIQELAKVQDGYTSSSSVYEHDDGTKSGYVTIRVPADLFDETLEELKNMALVVERETVSSEDVTERYIDLAARLKNAQAQEARYVEILEVAISVEEILQIEQALGTVRAYIESLTGQLQYLDSQTDLSTINITLSEEPVVTIGGKEFRPGTTVKQAGQAVVAVAQWLVEAVIWVVILGIGVALPLLLVSWLIMKGVNRMRRK